jgi:hypothetical protein
MDKGTNGLEHIVEGLQSLMELIGLFITLQILVCLITMLLAIAIDGEENKWIGTGGGLAKFDGVIIGQFITLQILDCLITGFLQ